MEAACAVVCRSAVEGTVVVVEHYMLAFVARDVCDALPVAVVLGYEKGAGVDGEHHAARIDEAALVVAAAGVLACGHGHVRRIVALTISDAVGAAYEDCVIRVAQTARVAVASRNLEKLCEAVINGPQYFRARTCARENSDAARRLARACARS